jgi:nucleoid-associated protein YgaU
MNNSKKLLALACAAALIALPAFAQDKAKPAEKAAPAAAPKAAEKKGDEAKKGEESVKVLIDNEKVRVSEVTYKPGATSAMRERNARVSRALTDGSMERIYPDGKKETVHWKAGEVKYFPKQTFVNKNVGKKDMVLYVVTPK